MLLLQRTGGGTEADRLEGEGGLRKEEEKETKSKIHTHNVCCGIGKRETLWEGKREEERGKRGKGRVELITKGERLGGLTVTFVAVGL